MDRRTTGGPGQGEKAIILCERCFAPIGDDEPMVRDSQLQGAARWVHTYRHLGRCAALRQPAHRRPSTGSWDARRGVGVLRTLYGPARDDS
jgi:hypothetical protein